LAPAKSHNQIEASMSSIRASVEAGADAPVRGRLYLPAGQSTQMIVGATSSTDSQILAKSSDLYKNHRLRRVYYSAFSPIPYEDSRLPSEAVPLIREHRLYQADWLFRFYGFTVDELTTENSPNLPLDRDPKLAWALRNRQLFPVDINRAPQELLLRIPGFGVRTVRQILQSRRIRAVTLDTLRRLRVSLAKVSPWIVTADRNTATRKLEPDQIRLLLSKARQLDLFAETVLGEI